ncbi:MAG: immunoglobulin domain-containing protein [Verrucomicrobiota bacterium]
MNRRCHFRLATGVLSAGLLLLAGSVRAVTTNVLYGDYYFSPEIVTIHVGDTINWTPAGSDTHTLLGTGSDPICGGVNLPCSYTFDTAGNYPYECTLHFYPPLNMTGMVVVLSLPPLPVIAAQPQSQIVLTNTTVTFSVAASNAAFYQWQSNGVDIAGQTNASLILSNVVTADSATYRVIVGNLAGTVASSNANLLMLTVGFPVITVQPQSQTVLTNTTVTFSVTASNAAFYQWQSNSADLPGQTNSLLILSNVITGDSATYQVVVGNLSGSATSSNAVLIAGYPISFLEEPMNLDVLAGTPVTLQVEAAASPAPHYQWLFNDSNLPGQTNTALFLEAATPNLQGTYSVLVSNAFAAVSSSNVVLTVEPLTSVTREKLAVTINPPNSGAVLPNLNGKSLIVAHAYTVAAVPGQGRAFAIWSGIVQSGDRSLTFVMPSVSNATLAANFIPSPFASNGVAGSYSGLFWDTNHLSNDSSGWFAATLARNGGLAGQIKIAGVSTPFSTTLHADGSAAFELKRDDQPPLVLTLLVDLTGLETLTGTVGDANDTFNAQLTARRAAFAPSHRATDYDGYYTWAMPGAAGNAPAGYSYGTAAVGAAGGVRLSLFMSDGANATASGEISSNGQMPLYASLYGGKGSLLSWLSFTNSSGGLSTNSAFWFKDGGAPGSYSNGFTLTNLSLWMGAFPAAVAGTNALNAANVSVLLSGANLTNSIAEVIAVNPNGIGGSFANIVVTISDSAGVFTGLSAGTFTGFFKHPVSGNAVRFNGAILHPLPAGYGFFTTGGLSGAAVIEPQ